MLLVLVTFAWGATSLLIKNALSQVSPLVFNVYFRMVVATIALVIIFRRVLPKLTRQSAWGRHTMGVFLLDTPFELAALPDHAVPSPRSSPDSPSFLFQSWWPSPGVTCRIGGRILGVFAALTGLYLMTIPSGEGFSLAPSIAVTCLRLAARCRLPCTSTSLDICATARIRSRLRDASSCCRRADVYRHPVGNTAGCRCQNQ